MTVVKLSSCQANKMTAIASLPAAGIRSLLR